MTKRRLKEVRRRSLNYEVDGLFHEGLQKIHELADQLRAEGATEISFDTDYEDYDEGSRVFIVGMRPETLKEEQDRKKREREDEQRRLEYHRKDFERLKELFENNK